MDIALRINGATAILWDNQQIRMEETYDVFDLEIITSTYSWPFTLPREGNENIFGHPHEINATANGFDAAYVAEILIDGNVHHTGSFLLKEANRTEYKGSFSSVSPAINAAKPKQIKDLIILPYSFPLPTDYTNLQDLTGDVFFPTLNFGGDTFGNEVNEMAGNSTYFNASQVTPAFTITWLLQLIAEQAGYAIDTAALDQKLFLFGNTSIDQNGVIPAFINVQEWLPDCTLQDLISDLCIINGCFFSIHEANKKLSFIPIAANVIEADKVLDFRIKLSEPVIEAREDGGYNIEFENNEVASISGTDKGILQSYADLLALPAPALGDYYLLTDENAYFIYNTDPVNLVDFWEYKAQAILPYTDAANTRTLKIKAAIPQKLNRPWPNGQRLMGAARVFTGKIVDNGGQVRIQDLSEEFVGGKDLLRITDDNYPNRWFSFVEGAPNELEVVCDYAPSESEKVTITTWSTTFATRTRPYITINSIYNVQQDADFAKLPLNLLRWHGFQPNSYTYPAGLPDNWNLATQLDDKALRLNQADSIIDVARWQRINDFLNSQNKITCDAWLNEVDIYNISATSILRHEFGYILPSKLTYLITKRGLVDQEIEGRTLI